MNEPELIAFLREIVKENVAAYLRLQPAALVVSVDGMEALARLILRPVAEALFEAWVAVLGDLAKDIASPCPKCGKTRKCKTRPGQPMKVQLLGLEIVVPKLYLECGHCDAPGVSITRLLTGLQSGASSLELKLMAGYCGAQHSYGKASRDLHAHHGQPVERTAVRRMALEVEQLAMEFVEGERVQSLQEVSAEQKPQGVERLMLQGDGGSVRTGTLVEAIEVPGYTEAGVMVTLFNATVASGTTYIAMQTAVDNSDDRYVDMVDVATIVYGAVPSVPQRV